ncbi:MAG: ABC transporter ATP-binding protein [Pseudomonadota bacterium]
MSDIRLEDVHIRLGSGDRVFTLSGVNVHINQGEFIVIVGGSGTGKSTLLRAIAGLEDVHSGKIRIGDKRVDSLPPAERGLAMVFQNYALYPHMTVEENIGFSLRLARVRKSDIANRVREAAERLQIDHLLERKPAELSGGQRQRVAIGRAIVRDPEAFLFDEPLSNLDTGLRNHLRIELLQLHRQLGVTSLYVTHDQIEAMTLADRIILLSTDGVEQIGTPEELFEFPENLYTAKFIGTPTINLLSASGLREKWRTDETGRILPESADTVGFRPRRAKLADEGHLRGEIALIERLGDTGYVHINVEGEDDPVIITARRFDIAEGDNVAIELDMDFLLYFDESGNRMKTVEEEARLR